MFKKLLVFTCIILLVSKQANCLKAGKIEISPKAGISFLTDDNIYLDPTDKKSSQITTLNLGSTFNYPFSTHKLSFVLDLNSLNYSYASSTNNATHILTGISADFKLPSGINTKIQLNMLNTTDPPYNELVERIKRSENKTLLDFEYILKKKFIAGFEYNSVVHSYTQEEYKPLLDRTQTGNLIKLGYNITQKTAVFLGMETGNYNYTDPLNKNDSTFSTLKISVRGNLTPKTVGIAEAGSYTKNFSQITDEKVTNSLIKINSRTDFSKKTALDFAYTSEVIDSIYQSNLYYVSSGFSIKLNQKFSEKFTFDVSYSSSLNDYPEETTQGSVTQKRKDAFIITGLNAGYNIKKWLSVNLNYSSKQRQSNFDIYDYDDTVTGLSIKALF